MWRLLGGKRERLNAYASMLGYSVQPTEARKAARAMFDRGFHRQKWFFMNGPADGAAGLKQNIELAHALREELGPEAILMFDGIQYVWKSADVDYAIELAKKYPGVQVVPHGHHVLAASACVASQSEAICPMLEYLIQSRVAFQRCQTRPLVAEAGTFAMPDEPGLGPPLDEVRMDRV